MDWNAAIEKNREALKRVLAMLVGMAGFSAAHKGEVEPALTLPRHLHRAVLRILRPAEAAARRLIVVAARGVVVTLPPARPRKPDPTAAPAALRRLGIAVVVPAGCDARAANGRPAARLASLRLPSLPLVDHLRLPYLPGREPVGRSRGRVRYVPAHRAPRILNLFGDRPPHRLPPPPGPNDPIDAARLRLRLAALASALDDLPGQALRLARWTARRRRASEQGRFGRTSPLKPGRAAALPRRFRRERPAHEVHDILRDLHGLARWALEKPDTS